MNDSQSRNSEANNSHSDKSNVALIGNPNTGKSTIFNALSGLHQHVGNYPGVTVEKKIGSFHIGDRAIDLIDLPGTYSLAAKSPDEMVSVDVLVGRNPDIGKIDVVVCVVDANNLQRNLYLFSQLAELQLPVVLVLNMIDVAEQNGISIDASRLSELLGIPIVISQANRRMGLDELRHEIAEQLDSPRLPTTATFPEEIESEIKSLSNEIEKNSDQPFSRFFAQRLLFDKDSHQWTDAVNESIQSILSKSKTRLKNAGVSLVSAESVSRYSAIEETLSGVCQQTTEPRRKSWNDRLDRILTHWFWGTAIFMLLMLCVFQAIFSWSGPFMDMTDWLVSSLSSLVSGWIPDGAFNSLVTDGMIAGVGGVLIFLPQIFALFFFIAILEDCGYMARAAYLMDKLMSKIGLSGKSFIPLLSSFACAIPGIMATRVIENRRDRLITILIAPLMSCSARLPVYTLLIAAFIPKTPVLGPFVTTQGVTMFAMYFVGAVVAVIVAFILRKTILRGETPSFVMELPQYKWPSFRNVIFRMGERGWAFVRRAGTLIFAVSIVIWGLTYFPRNESVETEVRARFADRIAMAENSGSAERIEQVDAELNNAIAAAHISQSYLGTAGKAIEPIVRPLGWDWRIACGAIASFPAREVIVGTLGVIFSLGDEAEEQSLGDSLKSATWEGSDRKLFNIPVALSVMVFFALCAQCMATLAIIKRETNSWTWPVFTFIYMTALAYVAALLTYQIGMFLGG